MKSKHSLYMRRTILVLICAVLILATLGLVMLYSSSMVRGDSQYDNAEHFITRQLLWLSVSLMAGIVCARMDLRWVRTATLPLTALVQREAPVWPERRPYIPACDPQSVAVKLPAYRAFAVINCNPNKQEHYHGNDQIPDYRNNRRKIRNHQSSGGNRFGDSR